jgi:cellulose synthase/poly-beta-1,6-N-acetylglucosamine synthase-like glycosyltransferase
MLMIFGLALFRKRARPVDDSFTPKVTVVIPAYNEENVVAKCIRSVLASNYDNFDVLVIDDGSTDETFNELLKFRNNPQVQIFAQLNRGKWSALNAAVANIDAEIMVCIDADTEIHPDAIGHLARQFCNPRIGAVAGKIAVGNRNKLLTRLQALEYVTAQNFDRRGFDMVNGLLVVPGAIGAWRVAAVREVGVFCNDTITEDADLTISLNRAGYRVTYEDKAVAYTEAPESVRQLLAQRLRWSLGMFQCAWKHKGAFREGRAVGLVSIPDMFIFGYLFPLLAPIADLFILILLYNTFSGTWDGQIGEAVSNTPSHLIWAYLTLPLLDLAIAAFALKTDRNENMRMLLLFPFQRFFYRQLLYFSVYRSLLRAVSGTFAGWGRMKRVGRQYFHQRTAQ